MKRKEIKKERQVQSKRAFSCLRWGKTMAHSMRIKANWEKKRSNIFSYSGVDATSKLLKMLGKSSQA